MKQIILSITLLLLAAPGVAVARQSDAADRNVNSRYLVDRVSIEGVSDSSVSTSLRADMKVLVGRKYDQAAVDDLADRMRRELRDYRVEVTVGRGETPDHVKVTFGAERRPNRRFDARVPAVVYYSGEGWSGTLAVGFDTHHNYFSFALASTADELLERNAGYRLRYEHRRVGTDAVQVGVGFDVYHPTFLLQTHDALAASPEVPGVYRRRENFAPSVSVLPFRALKLTGGVSLQTLDVDVPIARTERAYAFTADAQLRLRFGASHGYRQTLGADYGLRRATPTLASDFVYTRHVVTADYTLSQGRHLFGAHLKAGSIDGTAPLFERFLLGNSSTLRGWNKFDVAPLGGSRLAYGSIEYRYRPFQVFYDFGSVWDRPHAPVARHSVGLGLVSRGGAFLSVAFPVRLNDVSPVLLFGVRY